MNKLPSSLILLFFLLLPLIFSHFYGSVRLAEAGKRKIEISDDLDDVIDDEEDEAWKEWGQKSSPETQEFDPPPDISKLSPEQIQAEMAKRTFAPVFGFVKLRLGVRRTKDMVLETAMKWNKVLKTGGIEVKFMGVDLSTIMFNVQNGKDAMELKDFILNQPEAYEVKIGEQSFRRPGDPPLEEVIEKLQAEENKDGAGDGTMNDEQAKDEL
ncbi:PREDICTED: uncharacterized protein LOC104802036 [Tarenaya hassleriana]|uniref:uncharacterized protein LOC104802036 n=1 Tax=Tarenaya hassleriana TaxID=28532 RepID=UPI00053C8A66|nr:PREDICTED: uncharacterized protein LOC104802036 [Tarenaya hassleriana]XP_010523761.1 PREDICTED: uncharacterized protein LOC104802036 [Tarenaya hassleriana]